MSVVEVGFAAMAAAVWRHTSCCSYGLFSSTPECSSRFELSGEPNVRYAFHVYGLPKLTLGERRGGKRLRSRAATSSMYSPLVESFENTRQKPTDDLNSEIDVNDSGAWNTSSPADTPSQQSEAGVNEVDEGSDSTPSAPEDPLTAVYEDGAHAEKFADIDMKKSARGRPRARARAPSMSISQSFSTVSRHVVSHTVGATGHPQIGSKVPGPIGFVMAFAFAVLGVKTAVEKQGILPGTPQKICEKCEGYGVQECHVCHGLGVLNWEGKLRHTDPCPCCFGRRVKKCSSCGGVKMKKGMPLALKSQAGAITK